MNEETILHRLYHINNRLDEANNLKREELELLKERNTLLEKSVDVQVELGAHQVEHDTAMLEMYSRLSSAENPEEAIEDRVTTGFDIKTKEYAATCLDIKAIKYAAALEMACPECGAEEGIMCLDKGKFGPCFVKPHALRQQELEKGEFDTHG
jgi:Zn finger protein HypA/HybF involved in hydrogenase expression